MPLGWELLIILGLIVANGFFAAAEIAILTARRSRLEARAKAGDRRSRVALRLASNPQYFLPTVQVGISLVGTLASAFGGARIVDYLAEAMAGVPLRFVDNNREAIALGIVVLCITFFSLVIGELVPKRLALAGAEGLARSVALPMQFLALAARPAVWFLGLVTESILFLLGSHTSKTDAISVEEIEHLIRAGALEGVLEPAEQKVAVKALRLGDRKVNELMRPRIEVDAMDIDTPHDEVMGAMAMSGFSRLPVYEGDLDHIIGFVYNKDLLRELHMGRAINLRKVLRPVLFVPETLSIDRLLDMFRKRRTQMAVVLDEYGGTEGLITLEDILEELIGDVHDEHRLDQQQEIVRRDEHSWLVDGAVNLDDLLERMGLEELKPPPPRDFNTLGGLIQSTLDRIPRIGERIEWNRLSLEVVDMDGPRIDRILITVRPLESADGESKPANGSAG
jgi:putative hemolysin